MKFLKHEPTTQKINMVMVICSFRMISKIIVQMCFISGKGANYVPKITSLEEDFLIGIVLLTS